MLTEEQQDVIRTVIAGLQHDVDSPDADMETLAERTVQTLELVTEPR